MGVAHIGVLRALNEIGIFPHAVAGTSMGAIAGALYALHRSTDIAEKILYTVLKSSAFKKLGFEKYNFGQGDVDKENRLKHISDKIKKWVSYNYALQSDFLIQYNTYKEIIDSIVPDIDIRELTMPFGCVSTELTHGRPEYITSGSLRNALYRSSAIQGIIEPFFSDGRLYADGGPSENVPVTLLKQFGGNFAFSCFIGRMPYMHKKSFTVIDAIKRANETTMFRMGRLFSEKSDFAIEPQFNKGNWWNFTLAPYYIKTGYQAVMQHKKEIKKKIFRKRVFFLRS